MGKNILDMMTLLQKVIITNNDTYYGIEPKECGDVKYYSVSAAISKSDYSVHYYVEGVYDNGSNYAEIDMEQLKILQEVAEQIKGEL